MTTHPILGPIASVHALGVATLEAIQDHSGCSIPTMLAEINARAVEVPQLPVEDKLADALQKAFYLGERHWQLADSESYSDNRKSGEVRERYEALVKETLVSHAASLAAPPAQGEGVMVPREPTQAMIEAAAVKLWHGVMQQGKDVGGVGADVYKAMLATSPQPAPMQNAGVRLPDAEQPPFAGIAGCRPLAYVPQPAPAPVQQDRNAQAAAIVRSIAGMGFDSSDKEIADEAIRLARRWRDDDEYVHTPVQPPAPGEVELPNEHGFEQWYAENAFDYERNPIGSRDCSLMRKAWHAAIAALAQQRVHVSDEMVERACKKYAFREDGALFPDDYSPHEVAAERVLMREFLTHVIDQQQEARGNGE